MSGLTPNEFNLLDIGYGLKIGLKGKKWQVLGKTGWFDLIDISDFYRVVTLLESPYCEIDAAINEYAEKMISPSPFPLWKVVGAGLAFRSDQWARLALNWFPYLHQDEQVMLGGLLEEVAHSKWATQKSRQLANRYAKQVRELLGQTSKKS